MVAMCSLFSYLIWLYSMASFLGRRSPALEFWLALLKKCAHSFLVVQGPGAPQMSLGLTIEHRSKVRIQGPVYVGLHVPIAYQRAIGDAASDIFDLRFQCVVGNDSIYQAQPERFGGVDDVW